ncbi:HAD-IIA family hydrolase [Desulfovibrio sp. OttesenSCG-928-I05]|nr:HAD-IIA family hydrolase [Desulfovibrio sp. OttesenSCG-928-I05]
MDLSTKRCFVFDLDGTVYLGDRPIPGTVDFIRRNAGRFDIYFLTNNTSKNLDDYVAKLRGMDVPVTLDHMISPLIPLADRLEREGVKEIYPVGNANFRKYLRDRLPDLRFGTSEDCGVVVVGYDTELTYEKLSESCLLLQRPSVRFWATHPDAVCPSPRGPLPDTGSFLALYEAATGRKPELVFGKPNPLVLEPLLQRYAPSEMVMVGDRLYTDKLLAENAGMEFILVLSGESRREDLPALERQPDLVLDDLGGLD